MLLAAVWKREVSTNGVHTPKVVLAMDAGILLDCHSCFEVEDEEETLE
jgi:hypothetical protein